jgi:hypothetical protein
MEIRRGMRNFQAFCGRWGGSMVRIAEGWMKSGMGRGMDRI